MDPVYENPGFKLSTVSSDEKHSQQRGNQVTSSKRTKVPLIILGVSLVLALGGLCVLGIMYLGVSKELSALETNSKIMVKELTDNYTRVRETLFFYKAFAAQLKDWGGKLYYFSSDELNWSSSRAFCVSKGADLVTISNQAEQLFLLSELKEYYWIGLNDLYTEGRWVWVNNQTLTETGVQFWHQRVSQLSEPDNWITGSGDGANGENCAVVFSNTLNNWFDVSCSSMYKFICEKKVRQ
ncbi:hepatic lectin-like [Pimephales promelas]|uniref:hepatic lectin-like n=1 Tax=Pimephales promelas TaxID=90988 RepID=UPI001955E7E1|nr:hepatic lectin-like [Pimephales promelas]